MFLGKAAVFGRGNFLGKLTAGVALSPFVSIRPITEQLVEQILVNTMTANDIETLRTTSEAGEENRAAKWSNLLIRLTNRLKKDLGLPEDPVIIVIEEPDHVTIQTLRPKFDIQKHLLVLP